jgi:Leucine-rich repeat (LRR) protein
MEGTISSSLADSSLSGLRSINFSRNKLGGSIPTSFNNAGALPNLQSLDLSFNQLVGGPADFGMQGRCTFLYISFHFCDLKALLFERRMPKA